MCLDCNCKVYESIICRFFIVAILSTSPEEEEKRLNAFFENGDQTLSAVFHHDMRSVVHNLANKSMKFVEPAKQGKGSSLRYFILIILHTIECK